jgi:YHS domain-containing protein
VGVLVWIARAIIFLLLLRFVLRLLFPGPPVARRRGPAPQAPGERERVGGELVRDPNCGTYIPKAKAIAVGSGAGVKYFCSTKCQQEFEAK